MTTAPPPSHCSNYQYEYITPNETMYSYEGALAEMVQKSYDFVGVDERFNESAVILGKPVYYRRA